ncbi:MAG: tyrosine--tRNA ligase, partial [Lachnospiraceae bacterium]|nr:tyrosine--tRNA ligase [Lachnospiraceae bacterium]
PDEYDKIKASLDCGSNTKDCKLLLARTITSLYHRAWETTAAEEFFHQAFTNKGIPDEVPTLSLPSNHSTLQEAVPFLVKGGFAASNNEFRRLLTQGGISISGEKATSLDAPIESGDVLKIGKKKFVRLNICPK